MNKINFNCLLKSSNNRFLWLNILSAVKEKKKVPKQEWNNFLKKQSTYYIEVDDYLIEYMLVYENGNGEKLKNEDFVYHAYLSDLSNKEQMFINKLIKLKKNVKNSTAVTETIIV